MGEKQAQARFWYGIYFVEAFQSTGRASPCKRSSRTTRKRHICASGSEIGSRIIYSGTSPLYCNASIGRSRGRAYSQYILHTSHIACVPIWGLDF